MRNSYKSRFTALLLVLLILLSLAACGGGSAQKPADSSQTETAGNSNDGGSLRDKLNLDGIKNPPAEKDTSSGEKQTPPAEKEPLSQRLEGVYIEADYAPDYEGEEHWIEIRCVGGVVLVEHARLMDGSHIDFWAQEIRPEDEKALSSAAASVSGINWMFSALSNDGYYWDAVTDVTITPTKEGVTFVQTLDDFREQSVYVRTEDGSGLHTSSEEQWTYLSQYYGEYVTSDPWLLGDWYFDAEWCTIWFSLGKDGSILYARKEAGMPMSLYTGAWGVNQRGELVALTEQIGGGTMPVEFSFERDLEDGTLLLRCTGDQPVYPWDESDYPLAFEPAGADWVFSSQLYEYGDRPSWGIQVEDLRAWMQESGCGVAVGYLGQFGMGYDALMEFLTDRGAMEVFPFLADIPEERFIDWEGEELYLVVPADPQSNINVCDRTADETDGIVLGQDLYLSSDGDPFLLKCNAGGAAPNTVIYVEVGWDEAIEYSPRLSPTDGALLLPDWVHAPGCGVMDISFASTRS